jgi:hypothetical protein
MKLLTIAGDLTAAIAKATKTSHSLESSVQQILASAVFFAVKDGNIQPINALFAGIGKGMRRAAIQAWLLDHAPVLVNKNTEDKSAPFVFSRPQVAVLTGIADKMTAEQAEVYAMTTAAVSWVDYKPEVLIPATFDVSALVAATIKRAKALQTKGSQPVHGELIAAMEALMPVAPETEVAPL